MNEQLRDIAPIEPSFFIITILIIVIIVAVALFFLFRYLKKNKKVKIDHKKEWNELIKKFKLKNFNTHYKKYYFNLIKAFKRFVGLFLNEKTRGLTLYEIIELLELNNEEKNILKESLERIYRGDYFFLDEQNKDIKKEDFNNIDEIVQKLVEQKK